MRAHSLPEELYNKVDAQLVNPSAVFGETSMPPFAPVRDGKWIHSKGTLAAIAGGNAHGVPVMIGHSADEVASMVRCQLPWVIRVGCTSQPMSPAMRGSSNR